MDRRPHADVAPGVQRLALRTPTLAPATETNSYLVGERDFVLVEPATPYADTQAELFAHIDARVAAGHRFVATLATHHHGDHVGAAEAVVARYGVPLAAHPETARRLHGVVAVTMPCDDGDGRLAAALGMDLAVLHTPGHAPGHLVLRSHADGWTIAGDMVSTLSTIIVDPDDGGDMEAYVTQLRRMAALGPTRLLPAHGDPADDGVALLEAYVRHREGREAKILGAVAAGAETLDAVVARAYDDTPPFVWPIAARSALAHLRRLEARGAVTAFDGDAEQRWKLRETTNP